MRLLFNNPWTWLLVFFLALSVGTGVFLFRGESATTVERSVGGVNDSSSLSEEDSEDIVKKLEEGSGVPEEKEEEEIKNEESGMENSEEQGTGGNEQGTMNKEQGTGGGREQVRQLTEGSEEQDEQSKGDVEIINKLVLWGFEETKGREIDTIVLHSTYNALEGDPFSVSKILDIYKSYGVSPHYVIARDGMIYRLVEEKNIAFHAGESEMKDGRKNVNDFSIGIEIIGKDDGSPSKEQYDSLKKLLGDIERRHVIKYVVGHSDIASGRKTDPWGFEWGEIN